MQAIAEEELKKPGPGDYTSKRMFDDHEELAQKLASSK